ncbi:MAG: D-alanyl-D-alanine carboxypeptidase/D-alanyl-D-alanine-endopeptidase [Thermoleophilia bacterium]|nr:D-alanyl-D-alanine carboxypeptidase/D-alanyl-D-alanine-endopeptidase [Thermoleophilia bacterium]
MRHRSMKLVLGTAAAAAAMVVPTAAQAATPIPPAVQSAIDTFQAKPAYEHTTFGLLVMDRDTDEVLLSQNTEKLFTTGSIMKTFTASALMSKLSPDYQFRTPVYRRGKVSRGTLKGNLVMVASGDYAFGLRDQPGNTMGYNSTPDIDHSYADTGLPGPTLLAGSNPLRAVNQIAAQIKKSGIKKVNGNVVVDDRLFQDYDGWPDGEISPAWVNENLIDAQAFPTSIGKPAKVVWRPKTALYKVVNRTRTGPKGSSSTLALSVPKNGQLILSGRIPLGSGPILSNAQVPGPSALMRSAMIGALRRQGIKVSVRAVGGNPRRLLPGKTVLKSGKQVGVYTSDPLSQTVKAILKVSANRGADLLACLLAVESGSTDCEDGLAGIVENNGALGVPPNTTFAFDGAGSNDMDRTSPTGAVALLDNVLGTSYGTDIYDGLPILGVDGTFRETGLDSPAKGMIRAKSGNRAGGITSDYGIVGAQTRIGYMTTKSGRNLVYADLVNNVPFTTPLVIFGIDTDMTTMETAIQQGY